MRKTAIALVAAAMSVAMTISPLAFGWYQSGNDWYFQGKDGKNLTDKWEKSGTHYCYLGHDGKLAKSQWVEGKYYVDENGVMLRNTTTPDGYRVGNDGRWIQKGTGNYDVSAVKSIDDALETIRVANSDNDWDIVSAHSNKASEIGFLYTEKVHFADKRLQQFSSNPEQYIGGKIIYYDTEKFDESRVGDLVAKIVMNQWLYSDDRFENQRIFFFGDLLIGLDRALSEEQVHQYVDPIYHRYGDFGYEARISSLTDYSFDPITPIY